MKVTSLRFDSLRRTSPRVPLRGFNVRSYTSLNPGRFANTTNSCSALELFLFGNFTPSNSCIMIVTSRLSTSTTGGSVILVEGVNGAGVDVGVMVGVAVGVGVGVAARCATKISAKLLLSPLTRFAESEVIRISRRQD